MSPSTAAVAPISCASSVMSRSRAPVRACCSSVGAIASRSRISPTSLAPCLAGSLPGISTTSNTTSPTSPRRSIHHRFAKPPSCRSTVLAILPVRRGAVVTPPLCPLPPGVLFPHSLGIFYQAMTQYLGFPHYGDEYKLMGLAAYGDSSARHEVEKLLALHDGGSFAPICNTFATTKTISPMSGTAANPSVDLCFRRRSLMR